MEYFTVDNVKNVLQISEDKWDSDLAECINSASALVDGFLSREGLAVPSPVPQILTDATKFFVAWDFRHRRDPVGAGDSIVYNLQKHCRLSLWQGNLQRMSLYYEVKSWF